MSPQPDVIVLMTVSLRGLRPRTPSSSGSLALAPSTRHEEAP